MNGPRSSTRRPASSRGQPLSRRFYSIRAAARRLDLDAEALRARCRRAAKRVGNQIIADLGYGIVAFKLGASWRVTFPPK